MILLDTNVLSELMRPTPASAVTAWLGAVEDIPFATTAITLGEILFGLRRLPGGERRQDLEQRFLALTGPDGGLPVLAYDEAAAHSYGEIATQRQRAGRSVQPCDIMIAAIAHQHDASIATRNVRDFDLTGLQIIDPWQALSPE